MEMDVAWRCAAATEGQGEPDMALTRPEAGAQLVPPENPCACGSVPPASN